MPDHTLRVIVADDEPVARRRVQRLLRHHADVTVVAECAGGRSAVAKIRELTPDVVFLDIQMPDLDGFGVIAEVGVTQMPCVVFVTAFDEYAIRAFDVHAIDYLLKPYDEERFSMALERARAKVQRAGTVVLPDEQRLRALLHQLLGDAAATAAPARATYPDRVAVKSNGVLRVLPIGDVDWFETDGNYIRVHVARASYLIRNTANRLQQELDPRHFARIHRRYMINLERVTAVEPWFGGDAVVHLRDGSKLRLSRNYREEFQRRMLTDHSESSIRDLDGPPERTQS